jgi:signal transduction histidine kinase
VALGRLRLFPTTESLAATVAAIVGARSVGRPVLVVDDDAMVDIDVDRFGQILDNLLENARMHGDGRATITVRRHADDAIVTISSPGQPIAPEDVQRLFEPFQRGRTDADGVGLGLFVCRSLVAAHGGQMGLRTSVDGNHFWLRLPVSPQTRSPVTTKDTCRAISTPWSAMRS